MQQTLCLPGLFFFQEVNMNSELFATQNPTKLFFRCAVPAVVTSVFGALYSVVDGIFVGKYLGEDALAAVNLMMPIIMIVTAISNMIATGASVNKSILLGEKKREEASRVFTFSIRFILVFSVIVSALGYFLAEPFVRLIAPGATEEAIGHAVEYLRQYRTIRVRRLARAFFACFREARFDPLHALRRIFLRRFPRRKLAISLILLRFLSENRQRNLSPYCAQGSSGASLEKSQENRRFLGFIP